MQALVGLCGRQAQIKSLSWGPTDRGGSKDVEGGHKGGGGGVVFRVTWGAEAGNHMSRHYRAQDTEAGAVLPEQEALESQGEGRGEGRQAGLWG